MQEDFCEFQATQSYTVRKKGGQGGEEGGKEGTKERRKKREKGRKERKCPGSQSKHQLSTVVVDLSRVVACMHA